MVCCYILASMFNVLIAKHENMTSACDINISLEEMFGDKSRLSKYVLKLSLMLMWLGGIYERAYAQDD